MQQLKEAGRKEFPLLVKGDVQGSIEAIAGALKKLGTDEVEARIIHSGVGGITQADVALANAPEAGVGGLNGRANAQAKLAADQSGIEIRYYNIIYNLVDDVKAAMSGLLSPERRETMLGNATILEIFDETHSWRTYKERAQSTYHTLQAVFEDAVRNAKTWRAISSTSARRTSATA